MGYIYYMDYSVSVFVYRYIRIYRERQRENVYILPPLVFFLVRKIKTNLLAFYSNNSNLFNLVIKDKIILLFLQMVDIYYRQVNFLVIYCLCLVFTISYIP